MVKIPGQRQPGGVGGGDHKDSRLIRALRQLGQRVKLRLMA